MSLIKNILNGLKNTFQSIVANPGKALLIGAAVYVGGGAMGWWETPFESINGAWAAKTGADLGGAASNASSLIEGGSSIGSMPEAQSNAASVLSGEQNFGQPGIQDFFGRSDELSNAMQAAPTPQTMPNIQPVAPGGAMDMGVGTQAVREQMLNYGKPETIRSKVGRMAGNFLDGTTDFIKKNPIPSMMMFNAAANATQPNALDILDHRAKLEREESDRRRAIANQNMQVGNINLGVRPRGLLSQTRGA